MTKSLPFTEAAIRRAVAATQKAGLKVAGIKVEPDGTIIVLTEKLAPVTLPQQDADDALSRWDV